MNSFHAAGFPFADFKVPSLDIEALFEAHRKNAAALTNANLVVFDGLKTLAQRQGELFRTTVDGCSKVTTDVLAGASFEERAANQADAARHICVSSIARFQELADIAVRTNVTAVDILSTRVSEAFDELRVLFAAPAAPEVVTDVTATSVIAEPVSIVEEAPVEDAVALAGPEPAVDVAPTTALKKAGRSTRTNRRPGSRG